MAANFPGSRVLRQNSEGHTSWSSPSLCTAKIIRTYFQTGLLPPPNTVCSPDALPFFTSSPSSTPVKDDDNTDGGGDNELMRAMKVLGETGFGYMGLRRGI
ncbi:hypothetical protein E4T39_06664 [Aureobasidium subglaciale]|nr:hypothetical protein E4T39_06664 [Aureobasidium subglaciale]